MTNENALSYWSMSMLVVVMVIVHWYPSNSITIINSSITMATLTATVDPFFPCPSVRMVTRQRIPVIVPLIKNPANSN